MPHNNTLSKCRRHIYLDLLTTTRSEASGIAGAFTVLPTQPHPGHREGLYMLSRKFHISMFGYFFKQARDGSHKRHQYIVQVSLD